MTYGYIRVSTDKQDTESQKLGIKEKAKQLGLTIDEWISDDGVSGAKEPEKRLLGILLEKVKKDDVIIVSEISRIGRKLFMIFRILEELMEKGVKLYSVKDAYNLDNSLTSKVLAFAFGMAAEIERDMIQKRTIEGLARKKAEGVILGRPLGSNSGGRKLKGKENEIQAYLDAKVGLSAIARIFGVNRVTVLRFIEEKGLNYCNTSSFAKQAERINNSENSPRKIAEKNTSFLIPQKEEIIKLIDQGKGCTEISKILSNEENKISANGLKSFLIRENMYDYFIKTNAKIRLEKNKNSGEYNAEKIKKYAGID